MAVASSSSSSSSHHHDHGDPDHGGDVSFQEAMMCLPQYLREEAACLATHDHDTKIKDESVKQQPRYRRQRLPTQPNVIRVEPSKRISGVPQYRRKKSTEVNAGGPRIIMHSFFQDSGRRTISGTGVFLPKSYTTISDQPSKKAAGFAGGKKNLRDDGNGNKYCIMETEASGKCCLNIYPDTSFPAEMLLPQEWTY